MSQTLSGRGLITVQAKTAAYTILASENGTCFTNTGASGTFAITLPSAALGLHYYFAIGAAQILQIEPATGETISLPSNGVPEAASDYIAADAIGETVHLMCCVGTNWAVMGFTGTWTAQ